MIIEVLLKLEAESQLSKADEKLLRTWVGSIVDGLYYWNDHALCDTVSVVGSSITSITVIEDE